MITITGTVGASGKYLVTGMPVNSTVKTMLKLSFENNTGGTNLALFAGTVANFEAGAGGTLLASSGGPGFRFLTIIDASKLSGMVIYVLRQVGTANSSFTLNVE
jgi:hypothetical protein